MRRAHLHLCATAGARWALVAVLVAAVACMPERRDEPADDVGATADAAGGDAAADGAADASDGAADAGPDSDGGLVDAKPLPVGCVSDGECAALVKAECKTATCDLATGLCVLGNATNGTPCAQGDKCLPEATCLAGACTGTALDCADDVTCTYDDCDPIVGCSHPPNTAPCDDADACTFGDRCQLGDCKGDALNCPGGVAPCMVASCDPKTGCKVEPAELAKGATVSCDDTYKCTVQDHCSGGACKGIATACKDDGNPCTLEGCQPTDGKCVSTPPDASMSWACDDGNPCTVATACQGTECKGKAKGCDDKNACTVDGCDPKLGCAHVQASKGVVCDDGELCTDQDSCDGAGSCKGVNKVCEDGNLCTVDACAPGQGCSHVAPAEPIACSDGDPCTEGDACAALACAGKPTNCDDADPCTQDACGADGCSHSALKNGSVCGGGGQCWGGGCVVAKCGNTACEYNETSTSCAGDCPVGGGLCAPTDSSCVGDCTLASCGDVAKACGDDSACNGLEACVDACQDAACRDGCLAKATPPVVAAWRAKVVCVNSKCLKNGWSGKNCKPADTQFVACVQSCQSALCVVEEAACLGKKGCAAVAACVDLCADGTASCIKACFDKGSADDVATYDTLTVCMNLKCL